MNQILDKQLDKAIEEMEKLPNAIPTQEELRKELEGLPVEDSAAKIFEILLPQFESQVEQLSKKGLARVLKALVKVPLVEFNFHLDNTEKNVYALVDRLLQCKFIIVAKVLEQEMDNLEKEKNENV